jgi:hypothetical protein
MCVLGLSTGLLIKKNALILDQVSNLHTKGLTKGTQNRDVCDGWLCTLKQPILHINSTVAQSESTVREG